MPRPAAPALVHAARRRTLLCGLALAAGAGAGCGGWPKPRPGAMELLQLDDSGPYTAPTLVVMLPGAYSTPQEFVDEGFVAALRQRRIHADVVIAGAKVEHYIAGEVLARLQQEVIVPARRRGVHRIWLVGISLGGLFALGCAARQVAGIDGLLLLAPYLGRRTLLDEIAAAGGPEAWATQRQPQPDDLIEHEAWTWLARQPVGQPTQPPLYLGHGEQDRFAAAHALLAARLPASHSLSVPGGHDWPAWRDLWQRWLDRGLLGAGR